MRSGALKLPFLIGIALLLVCALFLLSTTNGAAAPRFQDVLATPTADSTNNLVIEGNIIGDNVCLSCHGQPGLTKTLVHEGVLDLYVSPEEYAASIHGQQGYACVQCHRTYMEIPHPVRNFADLRDVTIQLSAETCGHCHSGEVEKVQNSVHASAMAAGERQAAVCADCHRPHAIQAVRDSASGEITPQARLQIPITCAQCHYAIYEIYSTSVHGAALLEENNLDVPTCINCHGAHNIFDPTTVAFRLRSPDMCATCHTNPELMDKYGLSTQVLSTYVADFHGTTVTLFEDMTPNTETNKPVCFDCHGVHDIASSSDPQKGLQVRENLLARCQVCHPDATNNFPTAWLSHYIPDPQHAPVVYYVNLFYKIFIPGVLGGMVVLVAMDAGKTLSKHFKKFFPHWKLPFVIRPESETPAEETKKKTETEEPPASSGALPESAVEAETSPEPELLPESKDMEPELPDLLTESPEASPAPDLLVEPEVDQPPPQAVEHPDQAEDDKSGVAHE